MVSFLLSAIKGLTTNTTVDIGHISSTCGFPIGTSKSASSMAVPRSSTWIWVLRERRLEAASGTEGVGWFAPAAKKQKDVMKSFTFEPSSGRSWLVCVAKDDFCQPPMRSPSSPGATIGAKESRTRARPNVEKGKAQPQA